MRRLVMGRSVRRRRGLTRECVKLGPVKPDPESDGYVFVDVQMKDAVRQVHGVEECDVSWWEGRLFAGEHGADEVA
jgi:hypothetical protein